MSLTPSIYDADISNTLSFMLGYESLKEANDALAEVLSYKDVTFAHITRIVKDGPFGEVLGYIIISNQTFPSRNA
jgi:hypothetical protein